MTNTRKGVSTTVHNIPSTVWPDMEISISTVIVSKYVHSAVISTISLDRLLLMQPMLLMIGANAPARSDDRIGRITTVPSRTRTEETERSRHQQQRVSEEFHSQARSGAETPGMHQMKPHHRSNPCSSRVEEVPGHPECTGRGLRPGMP